MQKSNKKIIIVCGPTATGKSDYAVKLAKKINGEVISADSRQVYKGLDIGTGKITKREMGGIPHHLLDICSPKKHFSVAEYQKITYKIIEDILKRKKVPIICGGTGFYVQAITDGIIFPEVKENKKLREKLSKWSIIKLQNKLKKLDPERFKEIDIQNPVRLIRAIEIAETIGKVPKINKKSIYKTKVIYLDFKDDILKKRIHDRLIKRIKLGMIEEVKKLHQNGLSWKRMYELGLEYRYISLYLRKQLSKEKMVGQLEKEIWRYAKRQRTWFKKYLRK